MICAVDRAHGGGDRAALNAIRMSYLPLALHLFGPLRVFVHGEPMPRVRTRSVEWLLALLALRHGRPVDRSWLAGTLWPESEESRARQNLRNDLVSLRAALGPEAMRIQSPSRDSIILDLAGADVDAVQFDRGIRAGDEASLRHAVEVYTGPLLEGCCEEWIVAERDTRAEQCVAALLALADGASSRMHHGAAIRHLRRAAALDPLRDSTVRRLMAAFAADGDPSAALEAYRDFRARLHGELAAEPDESTKDLFQQIRARARESAAAPHTPTALPSHRPTSPPPQRSVTTTHPPHPLTPLVGREEDVAAVLARLAQNRVVTLVGAGGVGKTRLAMEAAAVASDDLVGDVAWVELAPISDGAHVLQVIGAAMGVQAEGPAAAESLAARIAARLSDSPSGGFLVAVDNCEHVLDAAAATVEMLLRSCRGLRILATSRQRLGLPGEAVWRVPSLPVPDPVELPAHDEEAVATATAYPAVKLFLERADSTQPGFRLASREAAVTACTICRRLDGIPLALELAAARLGSLTLDQVANRLDDRFQLLARGRRAGLPRHQTLRALIDWSYDLLTPNEQALLRRLSVFAGGWTLEAAESVSSVRCSSSGPNTDDVLDLICSLEEASLLVSEAHGNRPRYRMLDTVRDYALERLREAGEEDDARGRHQAYFVGAAERAGRELHGFDPAAALDGLELEMDNLRDAVAWAHTGAASPDAALRLVAALWPFWEMRGYVTEGRAHLSTALNRPGPTDIPARAQALLGAAVMALGQRAPAESVPFAEGALERFRAQDDAAGIAAALLHLGHIKLLEGDLQAARALLTDGLEACRAACWSHGSAVVLVHLGLIAQLEGDASRAGALLNEGSRLIGNANDERTPAYCLDYLSSLAPRLVALEGARSLVERCLALSHRMGQRRRAGVVLWALGEMAGRQGDYDSALAYHQEAVNLYRHAGNSHALGYALLEIGNCHYRRGDYLSALPPYTEGMTLFRRLKCNSGVETACNNLGSTYFHLGDPARALQLHHEALSAYHHGNNLEGIVWSIERLAVVKAIQEDVRDSALLLGAASRAREKLGQPMDPWNQADLDRAVERVRGILGQQVFGRLYDSGLALATDQAIALALAPR